MEINLVELKNEVNKQIGDKETFDALLQTTFKGLEASTAKRAFLEGRMRGYTLKDFLDKNIYAVPFSGGYTLITSIDYARKIGQRNGVIGKSAPIYEDNEDGSINTCTVTIKKLVEGQIGEFTATVYFKEYSTGRNQWAVNGKPRTMIAKVAESHALRMACPEELSQTYVEEEMQSEQRVHLQEEDVIDVTDYEGKLEAVKTLKELSTVWADMPPAAKKALQVRKNELKAILDTEAKPA